MTVWKMPAEQAGHAVPGAVPGAHAPAAGRDGAAAASAARLDDQTVPEGAVPEPLTDELLRELLSASSPVAFTASHAITHRSLAAYLNQLLAEKGLRRADVVRAAGINETFGYQIFKGQRNPSRDKVLQLAFALQCDLVEANRLLQAAGVNELYCKDRRDAIIIFCIDRGLGLMQANENLYRFGEEPLSA